MGNDGHNYVVIFLMWVLLLINVSQKI